MKVKVIYTKQNLTEEVNEFIEDKKIIDIKYTMSCTAYGGIYSGALIMYEDE